MSTEEKTKEKLRKKAIFKDIKDKFNKWRFNMYLCTTLYIVIFIIAKQINRILIKPNAASWINTNDSLVIFIAAVILGFCFIADSIITSYLKTPLQRLALKIDISPIEEKNKNNLMRTTQETNELFKETLKKFGILVVPTLVYGIIDDKVIRVFNKEGVEIGRGIETKNVRSESMLFYICYLIPIVFATWRIWQVNRELNKIEENIISEEKKQFSD